MKIDKETVKDLKEDDAVSPVIGVILMVAITVILAAVIGTFVLGLGNNVQENPRLGVSVEQGSDSGGNNYVNVTLASVERADALYVKGAATGSLFSDISNSDIGKEKDICSDSITNTGSCAITSSSMGSGNTLNFVAEYEGSNSTVESYTID
ncbi:MAG: type IV pilin [Halobacteria archaeon]